MAATITGVSGSRVTMATGQIIIAVSNMSICRGSRGLGCSSWFGHSAGWEMVLLKNTRYGVSCFLGEGRDLGTLNLWNLC